MIERLNAASPADLARIQREIQDRARAEAPSLKAHEAGTSPAPLPDSLKARAPMILNGGPPPGFHRF